MTDVLTKTEATIPELQAAVRESEQHERALAREVDELPYLRWLQQIQTAALQVELADLHIAERIEARAAAKAELPEARDAYHVAEKRYNLVRGKMNRAEYGYDARRSERANAQKRLQALEQEYPGA